MVCFGKYSFTRLGLNKNSQLLVRIEFTQVKFSQSRDKLNLFKLEKKKQYH